MKSNVETAEVAQPYAQALMSIAQSKNQTEQFGEDARVLVNLLKDSAWRRCTCVGEFVERFSPTAKLNRQPVYSARSEKGSYQPNIG